MRETDGPCIVRTPSPLPSASIPGGILPADIWAKSMTMGWPALACSPQPQKISIRPRGFWYSFGIGGGPSLGSGVLRGGGVTSGKFGPAPSPLGGRCSAWGKPCDFCDDPSCSSRLCWAAPPPRIIAMIWDIEGFCEPPAPGMPKPD